MDTETVIIGIMSAVLILFTTIIMSTIVYIIYENGYNSISPSLNNGGPSQHLQTYFLVNYRTKFLYPGSRSGICMTDIEYTSVLGFAPSLWIGTITLSYVYVATGDVFHALFSAILVSVSVFVLAKTFIFFKYEENVYKTDDAYDPFNPSNMTSSLIFITVTIVYLFLIVYL